MTDSPEPSFDSVPLRARHDGWTPDRQERFIEALAETACVEEACRAVGMSVTSAYALRRRVDAAHFRHAWEGALDYGIRRLGDVLIGRAIAGVPVPHFYKGEQVGEHRRYDNRLAMWLLRYRDPVRYGKWLDGMKAERHPDGVALDLTLRVHRMVDDAHADLFRTAAGDEAANANADADPSEEGTPP